MAKERKAVVHFQKLNFTRLQQILRTNDLKPLAVDQFSNNFRALLQSTSQDFDLAGFRLRK